MSCKYAHIEIGNKFRWTVTGTVDCEHCGHKSPHATRVIDAVYLGHITREGRLFDRVRFDKRLDPCPDCGNRATHGVIPCGFVWDFTGARVALPQECSNQLEH